jgi:hypothetical protein
MRAVQLPLVSGKNEVVRIDFVLLFTGSLAGHGCTEEDVVV